MNNIKSLFVFMFAVSAFFLMVFSNFSAQAWVNPQADITLEGNKLYDKGNYGQALEKYGQALIELPDNPRLHFNMGNVAYKKEDYEQAEIHYNKTLNTDDLLLEAKADYNIGNCKFKQGKLKENTNRKEAIELYRQSLDYYKRAIELNPDNKDAKFNHEFIEKYIKELASKSKPPEDQQDKEKQEQKQDQQQDQQKKERKEGSSEEDQKQGRDKKEEEQKREGQEDSPEEGQKEGQSEEDKKEERTKEEEQQETPAGADQEQEKTEMSEEEARRLLDSLREEDLKNLDKKPTRTGREPRYKDW